MDTLIDQDAIQQTYYKRLTSKCYCAHSTLYINLQLYGTGNLELTESKSIITETLEVVKDSKKFD